MTPRAEAMVVCECCQQPLGVRDDYERALDALEHIYSDYQAGFGCYLDLENDPESVHKTEAVLRAAGRLDG